MKSIFKVLLCICALSVAGAGAAYAGPLEDAEAAYGTGDYKTALKLIRPLAEKGIVEAEYNLGLLYAKGEGVRQDTKQAAIWFKKAAEHGSAAAQHALGYHYETGAGVPYDAEEAVTWYRKASDQGFARAQFKLGQFYEFGYALIVFKDDVQAEAFYRKAADQGFALAQDKLNTFASAKEQAKMAAQAEKSRLEAAAAAAEREALRVAPLRERLAQAVAQAGGDFGSLRPSLPKWADEFQLNRFVEMQELYNTKRYNDALGAANSYIKQFGADAYVQALIQKSSTAQMRIAEAAQAAGDDAECKAYGAKIGSPAYVQCRISLKAVRQGVLDNQQKAAQDNARADQLKAQSAAQQRLAQQRVDQEAELQRQAAAQQQAMLEKERSDRQAMALLGIGAALLGGGAASSAPPPPSGTHTYNMNGRIVTCTTMSNFTNCF